MKTYVVTEGKTDASLIKALLDVATREHVVVDYAGGRSASISLAKSILSSRKLPVAIVLDADTNDESRVEQQGRIYEDLLEMASDKVPFRVFFAVPEIEAILFENPNIISKLLGRKISREELIEARSKPKKVLGRLFGTNNFTVENILHMKTFNNKLKISLSENPLIKSLVEFIANPEDSTNKVPNERLSPV